MWLCKALHVCAVLTLGVVACGANWIPQPGVHPPSWALKGRLGAVLRRRSPASVSGVESSLSAPIDHSDSTVGSFNVRYWTDDTFFDSSSPKCFLMMGGEGPSGGVGHGFMYQLAEQHKALVVQIEHRYYGQSIPFGFPQGYSTDNLKYLTVEQALADVALLLDSLNNSSTFSGIKSNTFTFGGSYSGALSAWFRASYPEHTRGSLSSSGVVNAILDFTAFDTQLTAALQDMQGCARRLRATTGAFVGALSSGSTVPFDLFGLRHDMLHTDFYYMIADAAAMAVQYGTKTNLCSALLPALPDDATATPGNLTLMKTFASFVADHYGPSFASQCFYDTMCVKDGPSSKWAGGTDRCWRWQKCTQLAYLQAAPLKESLRANALTLSVLQDQCSTIFGVTPNTRPINSKFGGAMPNDVSNVYFSDFSDDPWQTASVTTQVSESLPFDYVECDDCGHCDDLGAAGSDDPPELSACRDRFQKYLSQWMAA